MEKHKMFWWLAWCVKFGRVQSLIIWTLIKMLPWNYFIKAVGIKSVRLFSIIFNNLFQLIQSIGKTKEQSCAPWGKEVPLWTAASVHSLQLQTSFPDGLPSGLGICLANVHNFGGQCLAINLTVYLLPVLFFLVEPSLTQVYSWKQTRWKIHETILKHLK